jgi:hypothetical protein
MNHKIFKIIMIILGIFVLLYLGFRLYTSVYNGSTAYDFCKILGGHDNGVNPSEFEEHKLQQSCSLGSKIFYTKSSNYYE